MYKNVFSWLCMGLILCTKSQASLAEYFLLYWKRFQSYFKTIPALVTFGWIAAAGDYGGSYTKELDCSGLCIELDCDGSETWAWEPSLQICKNFWLFWLHFAELIIQTGLEFRLQSMPLCWKNCFLGCLGYWNGDSDNFCIFLSLGMQRYLCTQGKSHWKPLPFLDRTKINFKCKLLYVVLNKSAFYELFAFSWDDLGDHFGASIWILRKYWCHKKSRKQGENGKREEISCQTNIIKLTCSS